MGLGAAKLFLRDSLHSYNMVGSVQKTYCNINENWWQDKTQSKVNQSDFYKFACFPAQNLRAHVFTYS